MRVLHSSSRVLAPSVGTTCRLDDASWLPAAYAAPKGPWVRANMIVSVDGRVSGAGGRSGDLHTPADNAVFALLRALADVVLVGAQTARTEGYHRADVPEPLRGVRREWGSGIAASPVIAVVTSSGEVPDSLLEPVQGRGDLLVLICEATPAPRRTELAGRVGSDAVVVAGSERVDVRAAVEALAARGLRHVLCEGGPTLLGQLAAEGVLDELDVTTSPRLVEDDAPTMLQAGGGLDLSLEPALLLEDDGTLLARWISTESVRRGSR
jgi:riboflavin biosynthesis pyrimidine reductase